MKRLWLRRRAVNNGHPFDAPSLPVVARNDLRWISGGVSSHGHLERKAGGSLNKQPCGLANQSRWLVLRSFWLFDLFGLGTSGFDAF